MTFVLPPPRSWWYARMISSPVISPHAPAGGCSVARAIPVISQSARSSRHSISSAPCAVWSGCSGCIRWNPGNAATVSATLGLYFMVHEPSG